MECLINIFKLLPFLFLCWRYLVAEQLLPRESLLTISACNLDNATLDCGPNAVIAVQKAQYGYRDTCGTMCCQYSPTDCLVDVSNQIDTIRVCSGQSSCNVPVYQQTRDFCSFGIVVASYIYLEYYCIKKTRISSVCSSANLESTNGEPLYITNDNYPGVSLGKRNCTCSFEAQSCSSATQSYIIDSDLYHNTSDCQQGLNFTNSKGITLDEIACENYYNSFIIERTLSSNYINITYISDSMQYREGYFFIGLAASEPGTTINLSCSSQPASWCIGTTTTASVTIATTPTTTITPATTTTPAATTSHTTKTTPTTITTPATTITSTTSTTPTETSTPNTKTTPTSTTTPTTTMLIKPKEDERNHKAAVIVVPIVVVFITIVLVGQYVILWKRPHNQTSKKEKTIYFIPLIGLPVMTYRLCSQTDMFHLKHHTIQESGHVVGRYSSSNLTHYDMIGHTAVKPGTFATYEQKQRRNSKVDLDEFENNQRRRSSVRHEDIQLEHKPGISEQKVQISANTESSHRTTQQSYQHPISHAMRRGLSTATNSQTDLPAVGVPRFQHGLSHPSILEGSPVTHTKSNHKDNSELQLTLTGKHPRTRAHERVEHKVPQRRPHAKFMI